MPRFLRPSLPLAALILAATLAGCGHAGVNLPVAQLDAAITAQADAPDIATQIQRNTVSTDARGTLVKAMPVPGKQKNVTFLAYKALDNNLSDQLAPHLNVLERAGSSANVNVVALVDGEGNNDTAEYYLRQDNQPNLLTSPYRPVGPDGELDTGTPEVLTQAVQWGAKSYPAKFRWVDINSHGGGYYGICQDSKSGNIIRVPDMAKAVASAGRVDLLSFDACLMASVEVAYQLRNSARVMVASEDESYPLGMNYDVTLASIGSGAIDPLALGRDLVLRSQRTGADPNKVVSGGKTPVVAAIATISAIDLSQIDKVRKSVDGLSSALLSDLPRERATIMLALNAVKAFSVAGSDNSDFNHRDLHEVVVQLNERVADPAVKAACLEVQNTLFNRGGAIIMSRAQRQEQKVPRGLSIYLPTTGKVDPLYASTNFAQDTHWGQLLAALK